MTLSREYNIAIRIAVDETGDFKDPDNIKFGLVTLVTISDTEWIKFNSFMKGLYPDGYATVKGSNITNNLFMTL